VWSSLLVIVILECKSEAFATTFLPRSVGRGGSSATLNLLRDPTSKETEALGLERAVDNGIVVPPNSSNGKNGHSSSNGASNGHSKKNGHSETTNGYNGANGHSTTSAAGNPETDVLCNVDDSIPATFIAETNLPTDIGHFRMRAYRTAKTSAFVGTEPCVIYATDKPPFGPSARELKQGVPVRVHDQCLTSEVFRSRRCDCKEQLKMSLEYIQKHGGAIIYLQQEGRGIGLANKVAAYALQDHGLDTVDANLHLGFPEDCRQYGVIPSILADMGIASIHLLTNNPRKVERLTALGVQVLDSRPMVVEKANPYNKKYLETKRARMNHTNFGAMLRASADVALPTKPHPGSLVDDEELINEGHRMAANAIEVSLVGASTTKTEEELLGVVADTETGYCFGRQSVEDAIAAIAKGEMVVVVDDMDRENEGDLIMASDLCTPEAMAQIVRYSSGVVCCAMEGERMDELKLPPMVINNEDPKQTAFSVSVDGTKEQGITTGISAVDRSKTVQLLSNPETAHTDISRPGHIFPLRAKAGGVLTRDGHTEASIDLPRLAGLNPCGVLCEIVSEDNPTEMMRLPELRRFAKERGLVLTSIADLQQYRRDTEM